MPLEEATTELIDESSVCIDRLKNIKEMFDSLSEPIDMHLSQDAATYYKEWQKVRENEIGKRRDESSAQLYGRLSVYALKLGMLFTAGRIDFEPGLKISLEHMREACRLVDEYFLPMGLYVYELIGRNVEKNNIQRALYILRAHDGKITKRDLSRKMSIKKREMDELIDSLEMSDEAKLVTLPGHNNRPVEWVVVVSDSGK
jgi:hypothetical protein